MVFLQIILVDYDYAFGQAQSLFAEVRNHLLLNAAVFNQLAAGTKLLHRVVLITCEHQLVGLYNNVEDLLALDLLKTQSAHDLQDQYALAFSVL